MSARKLLNVAFVHGSLISAAVLGGLTGSWTVFGIAATVLLGTSLYNGHIRFGNESGHRRN